ncbi:unnamed protein product [Clonostachys byssicola]|uniref:Uncharacterized protein n=1 Tax=Clonostachys byssicola TaxID=160290 RepID=A0A9N9UX62_9HYPO|nr:unnamed protein product [Clonostachys byssicola]
MLFMRVGSLLILAAGWADAVSISSQANPVALAKALFGPGITVQSAVYKGNSLAAGTFTNGPSSDLSSGIILSSGDARSPQTLIAKGNTRFGLSGNERCTSLAGTTARDPAVLSAVVKLDAGLTGFSAYYQFATQEYPEYVGSSFNDVMYILVDGEQIAEDATGDPITLNGPFFRGSNVLLPAASGNALKGSTPVLKSNQKADPAGTHTIEIGVCDAGDDALDSAAFVRIIACTQACASGTVNLGCESRGGDTDGDGICDDVDNCPFVSNPGQENSIGNGVGDACRPQPEPEPKEQVGPENGATVTDGTGIAEVIPEAELEEGVKPENGMTLGEQTGVTEVDSLVELEGVKPENGATLGEETGIAEVDSLAESVEVKPENGTTLKDQTGIAQAIPVAELEEEFKPENEATLGEGTGVTEVDSLVELEGVKPENEATLGEGTGIAEVDSLAESVEVKPENGTTLKDQTGIAQVNPVAELEKEVGSENGVSLEKIDPKKEGDFKVDPGEKINPKPEFGPDVPPEATPPPRPSKLDSNDSPGDFIITSGVNSNLVLPPSQTLEASFSRSGPNPNLVTPPSAPPPTPEALLDTVKSEAHIAQGLMLGDSVVHSSGLGAFTGVDSAGRVKDAGITGSGSEAKLLATGVDVAPIACTAKYGGLTTDGALYAIDCHSCERHLSYSTSAPAAQSQTCLQESKSFTTLTTGNKLIVLEPSPVYYYTLTTNDQTTYPAVTTREGMAQETKGAVGEINMPNPTGYAEVLPHGPAPVITKVPSELTSELPRISSFKLTPLLGVHPRNVAALPALPREFMPQLAASNPAGDWTASSVDHPRTIIPVF